MGRPGRALVSLAFSAGLLAACDLVPTSPVPLERPDTLAPPEAVTPSPRSQRLGEYYGRVQRQLLAEGLLRQDPMPGDAPFAAHNLVDNFVRIGASEEYLLDGLITAQPGSETPIRRWTKPVRLNLDYGAAVSEEIRAETTRDVASFARRLGRITGHPVSLAQTGGNFHVAVLTVDELDAFAPRLIELVPGLSPAVAADIINLPRIEYCSVYTFFKRDAPTQIDSAVAIIRAEHPDLLRTACIHEELAQGMGLANDSPEARPSIFNDNDEFALLTRHDELLLQMLYDRRMPLGANADTAREIAQTLAAELLGGES